MSSHALCKTRWVSRFLCCPRGELNPDISVKCFSADSSWKMQLLFLHLVLAVHSYLLPSSCTWVFVGPVVIQGNSDRKQEVLLRFFFSLLVPWAGLPWGQTAAPAGVRKSAGPYGWGEGSEESSCFRVVCCWIFLEVIPSCISAGHPRKAITLTEGLEQSHTS